MKALFSQRHDIDKLYKTKQFSLPSKLRVRLIKTLREFDDADFYPLSQQTLDLLKKLLGVERLYALDNENDQIEVDNLWDFLKGGYPHDVLDSIEAFISIMPENSVSQCQLEINQAFSIFKQPWRVADGSIFKIDSDFLADEVLAQTSELLRQSRFFGPLEEFRSAREAYTAGAISDAIINANKALESTMKAITGIDKGKPNELIRKVIKSGFIPSYWEGFLTSFEDILQAVPIQRHQPGAAHGQGQAVVEFPFSLGELVLHLTGSLIVFLIKRHIDLQAAEINVEDSGAIALDEEIPF